MFSRSIDGLFGTAAAVVLWLPRCPLALPDWLTWDRLIGGSPGGGKERRREEWKDGRGGEEAKVAEDVRPRAFCVFTASPCGVARQRIFSVKAA